MKQFIHHGTTALAITACICLPLAPQDARAEANFTHSQVSAMVGMGSVEMLVSGPFFLSAMAANKASDASQTSTERKDEKSRRISAGQLPDMHVKSIGNTADGGRRVALEDPANPENRATLQWPKREDDPAAGFTVGGKIAFQPSPQGAGWMLRTTDGTALAFVPTLEAVDESRTRTL